MEAKLRRPLTCWSRSFKGLFHLSIIHVHVRTDTHMNNRLISLCAAWPGGWTQDVGKVHRVINRWPELS